MPPRARKTTSTKKVDETVENQEHPVISEEDRSPETKIDEPEVAKAAPANDVDITVINQESLGAGEVVDRNPEPQLVENSIGITYDVSKSHPELVDPDAEEAQLRKDKIRHTEGVMDAKDLIENDDKDDNSKMIELEFVESGLTAQGHVWRRGEVLRMEDSETTRAANADTNGDLWYNLSAEDQKERYGKVFFEKR